MPEKKDIRINILQIRKALSTKDREEKSYEIAKKLEGLDLFKNADHILFYYTHESEVDTVPLINKWAEKKQIYLPKLKSKDEFIALPFHNFDTLQKGIYGIPEPTRLPPAWTGTGRDGQVEYKDKEKHEQKLDLIIVPGAAFDKKCNRLGMGKGFYDRYLSQFKNVPKIALAFEEQMLDKVPKDTYDIPIDIVITDQNIYSI